MCIRDSDLEGLIRPGCLKGPRAARNSAVLARRAFFVLISGPMRLGPAALALLCALATAGPAGALDLYRERSSPYDLALTGRLAGVPAGETRYVRWSDLRALPASELTVDGEFVKGPEVLTAVFLGDLWKALPVAAGADTFLATCGDGYASVFTLDFISRYRPCLLYTSRCV